MRVLIQEFTALLAGKERMIDVEATDTIRDFKEKVRASTGIPPDLQRLNLAGRKLDDSLTLAAYNIKDGDKLPLLNCCPSGMPSGMIAPRQNRKLAEWWQCQDSEEESDEEEDEQGEEEEEKDEEDDEDEEEDQKEKEDAEQEARPTKQAKVDFSSSEMTKLAQEAINHAKSGQWIQLYALLSEHPGLVDARPEACEYGVLHQAAWHGDVTVVKRLIMQYVADVKLQSKSGLTAADIAREKGHKDALELLEGRIAAKQPQAGMVMRQFKVKMLGGSELEVAVRADGNVTDLEVQVAKAMGLGLCFRLVATDEQISQASESLPAGNGITCIVENPSALCAAAQKALLQAPQKWDPTELKKLADIGLGRCRTVGSFDTAQFKEDPYMPKFMHEHFEFGTDIGRYYVIEFSLIDGAKKCHQLIGVINEGDADCNSGFWGPVYLRPEFKRVGGLISWGDGESKWKISDRSWYHDADTGLFSCGNEWCGGPQARTPLTEHLAHALQIAKFGRRKW